MEKVTIKTVTQFRQLARGKKIYAQTRNLVTSVELTLKSAMEAVNMELEFSSELDVYVINDGRRITI